MRGAYINFCDARAYNLVDEGLKQQVLDSLKDNYYVTISDRNFYILNSKNIRNIENKPYILSVKSLGSLYYLYLTKLEGKNYCIYINRRLKEGHRHPLMVSVMYRFDDSLFQNTLFDGELLRDNEGHWLFVINNLVLLKGELMKHRKINQRLNLVYEILSHQYQKDEHLELCPLYVKRLFGYHEYDFIVKNYIPTLPYKTRGIYLEGIRDNKNYLYLFPRNQKFEMPKLNLGGEIKFVPDEKPEISLDFKEKKNRKQRNQEAQQSMLEKKTHIVFMARKGEMPDIYNLYCTQDGEFLKYGIAEIDSLKCSKKMRKFFRNPEGGDRDNINISCKYDSTKEKWIPLEMTTQSIDTSTNIQNFLRVS